MVVVMSHSRRHFLRQSFTGAGLLVFGGSLIRCGGDDDNSGSNNGSGASGAQGGAGGQGGGGAGQGGAGGQGGGGGGMISNIPNVGPLGDADANGVRLPEGFTSRIVAVSGQYPAGSGYSWHYAPDGGAVYPTNDGGWIYVSNSESGGTNGGVGALVFSPAGDVVDAYAILTGTSRNCAGGQTPWGTWLSCEETSTGRVWECDPLGQMMAVVHPSMGVFNHEAVAVDPVNEQLYLTEDRGDGRFYRFTPDAYPDLSTGSMEVMEVLNGDTGPTMWHPLPDPLATNTETRDQVPVSTAFDGGEGIWYHDGVMYFSTKGDNRVWAYDVASGEVTMIYDRATSPMPILSGVDNVYVSPGGDVLVAEDGGDLEIVAITPNGMVLPIMQLVGHNASEITGPAFDPSLSRLYFSSQRGTNGDGITFEISGPFFVES